MYDSVSMFIQSDDKPRLSNLASLKETVDHQTGERTIKGTLANLRVMTRSVGFSITGSLAKYYLGSNLAILTRQTTQEAIESLSDVLGVEIGMGRVYKIEIGSNLITDKPIPNYLRCLGESQYYERIAYKKGLLYRTSKKALSFYDKKVEMKRNKQRVPEDFKVKNILRYELKLNQRLAKQMGKNEVIINDLFEAPFYVKALDKWRSEYFKIKRSNNIQFDDIVIKTTPQLHRFLGAIAIKTIGESNLLTMLSESKDSITKMQLSRLRARVNDIARAKDFLKPNEAILELDSKVNEALELYR